MTGSEIAWWLEGILDDLLDLGSADIPLLLFKLFVLFVVSFFAWQLGRMVMRAVWSVTGPLLMLLWRDRDRAGAAALAGHQKSLRSRPAAAL